MGNRNRRVLWGRPAQQSPKVGWSSRVYQTLPKAAENPKAVENLKAAENPKAVVNLKAVVNPKAVENPRAVVVPKAVVVPRVPLPDNEIKK